MGLNLHLFIASSDRELMLYTCLVARTSLPLCSQPRMIRASADVSSEPSSVFFSPVRSFILFLNRGGGERERERERGKNDRPTEKGVLEIN